MTQRHRANAIEDVSVDAKPARERLSVIPTAPANDVGAAESAWAKHRPDAERLAPAEVLDAARCDTFRATENLAHAHAVIMDHRAEIDATGVRVDWRALSLRADLGDAMRYVEVMPSPDGAPGVRDDIDALSKLVGTMRSDLRNLVRAGVVRADDVGAALDGWQGPIAMTAAALALAAVYERVEPGVRGRSVVSVATYERARRLANDLVPRLDRTRLGDRAERSAMAAARDRRNRVWTLMVRHHDQLARLGGLLWGHDVAEKVPTLRAVGARRRRAKKATPTPVTG